MKKSLRNKKGFTVVEVMLVLAIAGLIFMMVFIALPQLQKTQRDAERKNHVIALVQAIQKYQSNHRGGLSDDNIEDLIEYVDGNYKKSGKFMDPNGKEYDLEYNKCKPDGTSAKKCQETPPDDANDWTMIIRKNATCSSQTAVYSNNPKKYAVLLKLETSDYYCVSE